jgi:hypothetical protein
MTCIPYQILQGDQINEDEMGEECGAERREEEKNAYGFGTTEATLKTKA